MGHFEPDQRKIASHYTPLIGPYDSNDPDALEYQALLMKYSGLDGAIIDWYGREDVYDYATNHRNTLHFIKYLKRAGLKFAICYEDQTLPNLIKFKKVEEKNAVTHGKGLMSWVDNNWFSDKAYVRLKGKPVFLVFGPQYYKGPQWNEMLKGIDLTIYGVNGKYDFPTDGYAWPYPKGGNERMVQFYKESTHARGFLGVAYPRFHDIYAQAKVHDSWGTIPDDNGKTFDYTFKLATDAKSPIIQIATWNDWGEGTQIEPSKEFGYRDLEKLQRWQKPRFKGENLRLPLRLFNLRKGSQPNKKALDEISNHLFDGQAQTAAKLLDKIAS